MEPIAIIGCAGRFPGAPDKAAYWDTLTRLQDALREVPPDRFDIDAFYDPSPGKVGKIYTRRGGFIDAVDCFDHAFFDLTPREAASADPQQRLLLETAWAALEDAAIVPSALSGSRTGVYFGLSTWDYNKILNTDVRFMDAYVAAGSTLCVAANRLSHWLNLRGPSMAVDTACSSSLVAVHMGCQSLLGGDADLVVVGGANVIVSPESSIVLSQAGMLAPDGRCKTFDASADGYVRSEGCGVFVLKRLADAQRDGDPICAVILGSAVNHNGKSNGLTAPSGPAQQALIREALARAGVGPEAVSYVETHGTGTRLGDPIEVGALRAVYAPPGLERPPLALGAAKAVVGHAEAAAGAAGLLKVIEALEHGCVPAQPPLSALNPLVAQAIKGSDIAVATEARDWHAQHGASRMAGVSSFGFGGANAHLIVAGPEHSRSAGTNGAAPSRTDDATAAQLPWLLPLSAKSDPALRELARRMAAWLRTPAATAPRLADICHTVQAGRAHWPHRLAVAGRSREELASQLMRRADREEPILPAARAPARLALVFSGQGTLYAGVARELLAHPTFGRVLERCDAVVRQEAGWSLLDLLAQADDDAALNRTEVAQPLLYALQCAMVQTLRETGMPAPAAVMGHSLGEFSAACAAGIFSLEDGLRLVVHRARLMAQVHAPGAMLAVSADEATVREHLAAWPEELEIACRNAPADIVLAGPLAAIEAAERALDAAGVTQRRLATSHAFHSRMMQPAQEALAEVARGVEHRAPTIALVSSVTGELIGEDVDWPAHWARQLCSPVEFDRAQTRLAALSPAAALEVGTHPVLASLARRTALSTARWVTSLRRGEDAATALAQALGALHVAGVTIDWQAARRSDARRVSGLPPYPFERHRHGVDVAAGWHLLPREASSSAREPLHRLVWAHEAPPRADANPARMDIVLLCREGSAVAALEAPWRAEGHRVTRMSLDVSVDAVMQLLREQVAMAVAPVRLIVSSSAFALPDDLFDLHALSRGLQAASSVLAALMAEGAPSSVPWLVCEGAQAVAPQERVRPAEAALWGVFQVALAEYPGRFGGLVDLGGSSDTDTTAWAMRLARPGPARLLALRSGLWHALRRLPCAAAPAPWSPPPTGTCLVTGAFGGLGMLLAQHLVTRGAGALLLQSHRAPTPAQQAQIDAWRAQGRQVAVLVDPLTGDTADARLAHALDTIGKPLAAIFHLAGARADAPLAALTESAWERALTAKVGTLAPLRRLAVQRHAGTVVLFSSIATVVGSPAQANYVAANALLEALARNDHADGVPVRCIAWGPWADAGAAARLDAVQQQRLQRHGLVPIDSATGLAWLDDAAAPGAEPAVCIAARADWSLLARAAEHLAGLAPTDDKSLTDAASHTTAHSGAATPSSVEPALSTRWAELPAGERLPVLLDILRRTLEATLTGGLRSLDLRADIFQQGVDSLLLMEWLGQLHQHIGLHLYPREAYQHPTLEALARYLAHELDATMPGQEAAGAMGEAHRSSSEAPAVHRLEAAPAVTRTVARARLAPALFVLSAPRSGSTLLRAMLAGHSRLFAPPELHLLQFETMRERHAALANSGLDEGLIRACMALMHEDADAARRRVAVWVDADWAIPDVYAALQAAAAPRLLVDKSPSYAMSPAALQRLGTWFDAPRAVHLLRDPHAMAESFERLRMHRLFGASAGGGAPITGEEVWRRCNANLVQLQSAFPASHWLRLRYEDLVQAPEAALRGLCDFVELAFEPALLEPHAADRMTDSVRPGGLQVGDPNFAKRTRIDARLAQVAAAHRAQPLQPATSALAASLGYGSPTATPPPVSQAHATLRERWIEANGQRLCVCEWGPAEGTPVLVLHGWQDQGASWDGVAQRLAREGRHVIAPDLRHHGRHRAPAHARPTAFDFVADAQALIGALGLRRVHLVGHSFGSVVASLLAAADDRCASLTLVEPVLPEDGQAITPAEAVRRHLNDLRENLAMPVHPTLEAIAQRLRIGFTGLTPQAARELAARIADPVAGGHACPTLDHSGPRLVAALRDVDRERYRALLCGLDVPLAWLRGTCSTHRRARDDAALSAALARAQAIDLPGGHNLHVDAADALAQALGDFVKRAQQDPPVSRAEPVLEGVR